MFKNDPVITYNHMREEGKQSHIKFQISRSKFGMLLFIGEAILILLALGSILLLMM